MAVLTHKHDISSIDSFSYPTDGIESFVVSHTSDINYKAKIGGGGAFVLLSQNTFPPGYLYQAIDDSTKYMAILDIFRVNRYSEWTFGNSPGGNYPVAGYWVAWSIYDSQTQSFYGPHCGAVTREKFGLCPMDEFPALLCRYLRVADPPFFNPISWTGISVAPNPPTRSFSTSATLYTSGGYLSSSGSSITAKSGVSGYAYTLRNKTLRFHGFLSYSGIFSSTKYAFVTVDNQNSVTHTRRNASWGSGSYPARSTETITHRVISTCSLNSSSVLVGQVYTPGGVLTGGTAQAFPDSTTQPIGIGTLIPVDNETPVTDVITNEQIMVPEWMTDVIFLAAGSDIFGGGEVNYVNSGWYGNSSFCAYWDVTTGEWSQYQAYSAAPPAYYTWYISLILDPMQEIMACNNTGNTQFDNDPIYTSDGVLGPEVYLYTDTALSNPYSLPLGEGWYTFKDGDDKLIEPRTVYYVRGGCRIASSFECA